MNTMKHFILGMALLLLAALGGQTTHAAPIFNPYVNLVSPPNGASYDGVYPVYARVPISVNNQYVELTGGTPSTSYTVGWSMFVGYHSTGSGSGGGACLASDSSAQNTRVLTDKDGYWFQNAYNTKTFSQSVPCPPNTYIINAGSGIIDPGGTAHSVMLSSTVTTTQSI